MLNKMQLPLIFPFLFAVEELYGTRYQSGSFSLINVGSGFHCLHSFFSSLLPKAVTAVHSKIACLLDAWDAQHSHKQVHTSYHTQPHTAIRSQAKYIQVPNLWNQSAERPSKRHSRAKPLESVGRNLDYLDYMCAHFQEPLGNFQEPLGTEAKARAVLLHITDWAKHMIAVANLNMRPTWRRKL